MISCIQKFYLDDFNGDHNDHESTISGIITPYVLENIKQKQDFEKAAECIRCVIQTLYVDSLLWSKTA